MSSLQKSQFGAGTNLVLTFPMRPRSGHLSPASLTVPPPAYPAPVPMSHERWTTLMEVEKFV